MEDDDELTTGERGSLERWAVVEPPPGFAAKVVAAAHARPARPARSWRLPIMATSLAAAGAALLVVAAMRGSDGSDGTLAVSARTTAEIGRRATIVAEPAAALRWHVAASGAAEIEQTAGDVFYRVERGGPFVVHTPAGDVRVTGTCLRIEVIPVKPLSQMIASGAVGAALATAVVVTVYEGHVIAEGHGSRTDVAAGSQTTLSNDGATATSAHGHDAPVALATATREQLVELAMARENQISKLKAQIAEIEHEVAGHEPRGDEPEDGRPWHDPSHERLVEWAQQCKIAFDEPSLARFVPVKSVDEIGNRALPTELEAYNATMAEMSKQFQTVVRGLYVEATGDAAGAESLSVEAMMNEIREKSPPTEGSLLMQKLSRERAGLQPPATDTSKMSPFERLLRAQMAMGDQSEQALAKRVGAQRASAIRGNSWSGRSSMSGCPKE